MIKTAQHVQLKNLIHSRRALAFVGSGFSSHVYDSWSDLICNLCEHCDISRPKRRNGEDAIELMRKADECRQHAPKAYRDYLVSHFGPPPVYRRKAYELLAKMPFVGYVTVNFDPMLEDEVRRVHGATLQVSAYKDLNILKLRDANTKTLFYLHGKIDPQKPDSVDHLVLGNEEFEAAYARENRLAGAVAGFLQQLFTYQSIVFFGCGLDEPLMNQVMERTQDIRNEIGQPEGHYALLRIRRKVTEHSRSDRDSLAEEQEQSRLKKCGITVLRYDEKDRFHSTVEGILEDLAVPPGAGEMPDLQQDAIEGPLLS